MNRVSISSFISSLLVLFGHITVLTYLFLSINQLGLSRVISLGSVLLPIMGLYISITVSYVAALPRNTGWDLNLKVSEILVLVFSITFIIAFYAFLFIFIAALRRGGNIMSDSPDVFTAILAIIETGIASYGVQVLKRVYVHEAQ